ncbi:MAG: hypothetical protein ACD_20C00234G0004 [uncultured bacterium]|nr:MAG: hypothetical protein ACD_20C00234G0004 [uncultured bacterium]HBH18793.1 hypothetical protein [Cyanobacteria bacterium UBA9579]
MSFSFGGVGSGLPVTDWIEQLMQIERRPVDNLYQKKSSIQTARTTLNTVEGKVTTLRSLIEKITDSNLASTFDLFSRKSATSSDKTIATVTASNSAAMQNITLKVDQLATATKAQTLDTNQVANVVSGTELVTDLGDSQGTAGTFSIYVDGVKKEFTIAEDSTVNSVAQSINDAAIGVTASVVGGKFQLEYANTSTVTLGSSADSSNFWNITQLSTATATENVPGTMTYASANILSAIDTSGTISNNNANLNQAVTEGTFRIGQATFTIDSTTTFSSLINSINNDEDAGVVAQYDLRTNKLVLTSKDPGKQAINLTDATNADPADTEPPTSNFLTAMGLIKPDGNSLESQTLGNNATVYLNGSATPLYANSNTLTGDITGIAGITINLLKETEAEETINITIGQDSDQLTSALNNFISKFNEVISEIDKTTSKTGSLKSDYTLVRFRNDLRQTVTGSVDGLTKYDSMAMIGITSGAVGTSVSTGTTSISLDTSKFLAALAENPSEVKALLIGDSKTGTKGILQTLESKVESALDSSNGYFSSREKSIDATILDIDKSIKNGELRLESVRKRLVTQFSMMDKMISQMQSQGSALSQYGL